ncbi:hypothetical protein PR003_g9894 [Phytophthora rubi]|uniref:Uncharacterized protein n=1 Tax=Phytophthora rubi TaxID=129364 RepID=A0A6A4F734_9STRA|nr:hypothetical protein PR003_g9894 [Phytophthora rubi]
MSVWSELVRGCRALRLVVVSTWAELSTGCSVLRLVVTVGVSGAHVRLQAAASGGSGELGRREAISCGVWWRCRCERSRHEAAGRCAGWWRPRAGSHVDVELV